MVCMSGLKGLKIPLQVSDPAFPPNPRTGEASLHHSRQKHPTDLVSHETELGKLLSGKREDWRASNGI